MEYFAEKLKKIISKEGLSASKFAEKIGVQRSSVSHILSGRNKPSLDFVLKIYKSIENIDLEWLLSENTKNESHPEHTPPYSSKIDPINQDGENTITEKSIDRIVIFFNNGSFKTYNN
jgi:transcriptional regulator with XRE-family HTH domain